MKHGLYSQVVFMYRSILLGLNQKPCAQETKNVVFIIIQVVVEAGLTVYIHISSFIYLRFDINVL